jgi:hypothetical protein
MKIPGLTECATSSTLIALRAVSIKTIDPISNPHTSRVLTTQELVAQTPLFPMSTSSQ